MMIRWGIIGVGNVTEVKSGPALYKTAGSAVEIVMRRDGAAAADYARRHGILRWTDDAQAVIDDPDVDAVYIATPPDSHRAYAVAVAQAGKPVYVEKPMARTYAECAMMIEACQAADMPLFVAFYRRGLPRFQQVKRLLDDGAIGTPRYISITLDYTLPSDLDSANLPWRLVPAVAGGGLFVDLGSHMLDLVDFLLGPIQTVQGSAVNQARAYPAEDMVTARFTFESGAQGVGRWCFNAFARRDAIEIVGSAGKLAFECFGETPIQLVTPTGETLFPGPNPPHIQQPLIETIIADLNGSGSCPSTGVSAARTARVIDQILADYRAATGQDFSF